MSGFRAGQIAQAILLGAGLAVGWLWLLHVATSDFVFRYQGF